MDKKYIWNIIKRVGAIVGGAWLIMEVLAYFKIEPLKDNLLGFVLIVALILISVEFFFYVKRNNKNNPSVFEALILELEDLFNKGEYRAILRRRQNFSRSLWVEGKPIERIKLGKIAEEAAVRLKDKEAQASILIDDLGWTSVSTGLFEEANKYIKHGLRIANTISNNYWIAKGHRHLSGIQSEAKNNQNALDEMTKAEQAAQNIQDENLKNEMLAGIYYGLSVLNLSSRNYDVALNNLNESERLRISIGDFSRIVKIYSLKGKIAEAKGDLSLAKDCYREGLEESKKVGRTDEIIRNHLGLSRIYERENSKNKSKEHLTEAQKLLTTTPIPYRIDEKEIRLQNLNN